MEKFAIVQLKNQQYKVSEGKEILIDKVKGEKGDKLTFDEVLLIAEGDNVQVGKPTIAKSTVTAEIIAQTKGEKVSMMKFKAKSRFRKRQGHREQYTQIKIIKIS